MLRAKARADPSAQGVLVMTSPKPIGQQKRQAREHGLPLAHRAVGDYSPRLSLDLHQPSEPDTFLGLKGQAFVDPLDALWKRQRPGVALPAFVRCPARRQPRDKRVPGILRCKSLFCPYCHNERQENLRQKLAKYFCLAGNAGCRFVTLTIEHGAGAPLASMMRAIKRAWQLSRSGSPFKRLKESYSFLGVVNILEVTYGENGWHAHIHSVIFSATKETIKQCAETLASRYRRALQNAGFRISERTVHEQDTNDLNGLAGYLTKSWLLISGTTLTIFALMTRAMGGDEHCGALFVEAFEAFHGLHQGVVSKALHTSLLELAS